MTVTILDCTPHAIHIHTDSGVRTIEPSGVVPRLKAETIVVDHIDGIPVSETRFGEIMDLPEEKPGQFLIVSRLVMAACPDRKDLLVPDGIVRDEEGKIVGCTSLARC